MQAITHSGKFHADDVLSWALLRQFYPGDITLTRTRDATLIAQGDIVFDVGNVFSPEELRFDHHQKEYQGPLSSAGMILNWLYSQEYLSQRLYTTLKEQLTDYIDAVDNGRRVPERDVPCFATMVDHVNHGAKTLEEFDIQFHKATDIATLLLSSFIQQDTEQRKAHAIVLEAMQQAISSNSSLIEFPHYVSWQTSYFSNGGTEHPTNFILFPTISNTWQVLAIPPVENSFSQKKPFPEEWAGLRDDELSSVTGEASIFCHKNRFIAVFHTRTAAINSLKKLLF